MSKIELVNMLMLRRGDKVIVLDRIKSSWPGLTFPGGHVEPGESIADSVRREAAEETGVTVGALESRGIVHWANPETGDRYMEFLFSSDDWSGEPRMSGSSEGRLVFMTEKELRESSRLSDNFKYYLPMFFDEPAHGELFFVWNNSWDSTPIYL